MKSKTPPPKKKASPVYDAVHEWLKSKRALQDAKASELAMRRIAIDKLCPPDVAELKEGTNTVTLITSDDKECVCKINRKLNRTLDRAALNNVMPRLPRRLQQEGVLIRWDPDLVLKTYRSMTEQERAIFDEAVTTTPGEMGLEVEIRDKA